MPHLQPSDRLPVARVVAELHRGLAMSLHFTARELSEESEAVRAQSRLAIAQSARLRKRSTRRGE